MTERFRRAEPLVAAWRHGKLCVTNYVQRQTTPLSPEAIDLLARLDRWTSVRALRQAWPDLGSHAEIAALLTMLFRRRLVDRESRTRDATALGPWRSWHPEAGFFHFGTKNDRYVDDAQAHEAVLVRKAKTHPPPSPVKHVAGLSRPLAPPGDLGDLGRALHERRTWRSFGSQSLAWQDVSTLLRTTFGIQRRGVVAGQGSIVLKTSPSGGARHSIEAYVIAQKVEGVPSGAVFHFDPERQALSQLPTRVDAGDMTRILGNQFYFENAGMFVVMAPVFARTIWRYASPRVYRAVLVEAGHLCQTFCLVATRLSLAPFCTLAFSEERLESILQLDGVAESPIYVAGVGTRPPGTDPEHPGRIPARPRRRSRR